MKKIKDHVLCSLEIYTLAAMLVIFTEVDYFTTMLIIFSVVITSIISTKFIVKKALSLF